jgi:hypothetical protein
LFSPEDYWESYLSIGVPQCGGWRGSVGVHLGLDAAKLF